MAADGADVIYPFSTSLGWVFYLYDSFGAYLFCYFGGAFWEYLSNLSGLLLNAAGGGPLLGDFDGPGYFVALG